ncbi:SAM-dependent methyltransferase [Streptomyces sp. NPDC051976]|uniref:SAM-dependent methyltransferase n=1 Tax=Streptomyces sp. NPDC051976 TaxID=3154947 RepID=UPI00343CBC9F
MTDTGSGADEIDTSKPHSARMYDFYLGGKDSYPADWEAAEKVIALFPRIKEGARTNREFMHRSSRMLAQQGIRQFLDIGTGIPTEPNLHQIVQETVPDAHVVYVDFDPIVLRHAEALLGGTPEGRTAYVQADVREPAKIIAAAREHLDFTQPVALSMVALMHFVSDEFDPYGIVAELLAPLAPGSALVLSHVTGDFEPATWERIVQIYRAAGTPAQVRSHAEVTRFFDGLELVEPGVVVATAWHPELGELSSDDAQVQLYVGVARK